MVAPGRHDGNFLSSSLLIGFQPGFVSVLLSHYCLSGFQSQSQERRCCHVSMKWLESRYGECRYDWCQPMAGVMRLCLLPDTWYYWSGYFMAHLFVDDFAVTSCNGNIFNTVEIHHVQCKWFLESMPVNRFPISFFSDRHMARLPVRRRSRM